MPGITGGIPGIIGGTPVNICGMPLRKDMKSKYEEWATLSFELYSVNFVIHTCITMWHALGMSSMMDACLGHRRHVGSLRLSSRLLK